MKIRSQMVASFVAAAALFATATSPGPTLGVASQAQAQGKDGKGAGGAVGPGGGGANRPAVPGDVRTPARPNPPTINRTRPSDATSRPALPAQARDVKRDRIVPQNRVVVRDGDRRRGEGEGRRRGTRYVWGPGLAFYFYDGFYHGDCSWLRRKARETGSSYWRQRFQQCRDA